MRILVAYESRYGSTEEIAHRIAETLRAHRLQVETRRAGDVSVAGDYDAFVIGSAVYYGSWLKDASRFVRDNAALLAARPVWLFSSGPIGDSPVDAKGKDLREGAAPKAAALANAIRARDHRVFFGKLEKKKLHFLDRLVASFPAFPGKEGDFRDWNEIEAWALAIAAALAPRPDRPAGEPSYHPEP